jgi:hypothetical protein
MTQPPAANPALTAVLRASLALEEGREPGASNPLSEASPESLDDLFDAINSKLVAGLPESITEADITPVVGALRARRLRFLQEQERKTSAGAGSGGPRRSGVGSKPPTAARAVLDAADLDI